MSAHAQGASSPANRSGRAPAAESTAPTDGAPTPAPKDAEGPRRDSPGAHAGREPVDHPLAIVGLLACAALVGLGGLGLETLLLSASVLAFGFGAAAAFGLATWVAAWALGAFLIGRRPAMRGGRALAPRDLFVCGFATCLASGAAIEGLLLAGRAPWSPLAASALAAGAIALAGLPQGAFLPLFARGLERRGLGGVGLLFGANLAGCVVGALLFSGPVPGALGRPLAAVAAGATAALGAWVAALLLRTSPGHARAPVETHAFLPQSQTPREVGFPSPRLAGVLVGGLTAWMIGLEWVCLRLSSLWSGGMQPAIGALLAASLCALSLGAWLLPPLLPRGPRGVVHAFAWAGIASLWPIVAAPALSAVAAAGGDEWALALTLSGPTLFPFGALLPCLHRALAGESGRRLGDLLLHEAWGALVAAPLAHGLLVPSLGLGGSLALFSLFACVALVALRPAAPRVALALAGAQLLLATLSFLAPQPALASPKLSAPEFTTLAFTEDRDFAVSVVDDGLLGERTLLTDEFRATGTGPEYAYMRALGHLPLLLHPDPRSVCVLAFGTGTTAGAVSLHPEVERLEVLELSRAVIEFSPWFEEVNHGVLGPRPLERIGASVELPGSEAASNASNGERRAPHERTTVHLGDGRRTLASRLGAYDVLTMEPLLPDSPFAVYLYTTEFYERARRSLRPGGLLCQWVPPHALAPETFEAVVDAFARAFPWSGLFLAGTQLVLIGGEAAPPLDARRFPRVGGSNSSVARAGTPVPDAEARLHDALRAIGLHTPAGLASRFVCSGHAWPPAPRPLTDADPWIIYASHERGAAVLGDLPTNLGTLRAREEDWPLGWRANLGPREHARLAAVRGLHHLREDWEAARASRVGWTDARAAERFRWLGELAPEADPLTAGLALIGDELGDEAEVVTLRESARFERARTTAFLALRAGQPGAALTEALEAASLRPRRGDVHLLVAVAADALSQDRLASTAAERAFERCPGLARTSAGRAILALGGDPAWAPGDRAPGD